MDDRADVVEEKLAFFDKLAGEWDDRVQQPSPMLIERLLRFIDTKPSNVLLDIGTGTGYMVNAVTALAAELGYTSPASIIACDISCMMLEKVEEKYGNQKGLSLLRADAADTRIPSCSVDVVICNGVYPHFDDAGLAIRELFRVARPGARIAVTHFIGRESVNRIHSSSSNPLIRGDLLEPAVEVERVLKGAGFDVIASYDEPCFFMVGGLRKCSDV